MGEVYRAADTKLGRDVALKVLPAGMASSPERLERFRREAKALAALDHPGIVTVYSVEEAEGVHFLTMQVVERADARQRLVRAPLELTRHQLALRVGDVVLTKAPLGVVARLFQFQLDRSQMLVSPRRRRPRRRDRGFDRAGFEHLEDLLLLRSFEAGSTEARLRGPPPRG
jgi:hypothetical protein